MYCTVLYCTVGRLDTELHKLEDCHKEIDIYRYQLQEANQSLDCAKEDMTELRETKEKEFSQMKEELERKVAELKDSFKREKKELKQALELEHELELDNFKEKVNKEENDQVSTLMSSIGDLQRKLESKEKEMEERLGLKDKEMEQQLVSKERELQERGPGCERTQEAQEAEWQERLSQVVPQIDPSVPQPVVQSRRRP